MSVFEQFCNITPKMQKTLENIDATLKRQIEDIFAPLRKFIETGDRTFLDKEFEKENFASSSATTQKRTRQKKPTILEEISENSLQLENVKVKQEKISMAPSESTCSVSSETFLKEISPKGRRTRQTKASVSEDSETPVIENVKVKKEKISTIVPSSSSEATFTSEATITGANIEIKKEDMPAPRKLPPRNKKKNKPEAEDTQKRSTRASERGKQSDVILQNTTITKIDITDTDSESLSEKKSHLKPEQPAQQSARATRSKMRQRKPSVDSQSENEKVETSEPETKKVRSTRTKTLRQNKRNRSHSSEESEDTKKEQKKSKSSTSSETEDNKSAQTEYEDAVSTMETNETEPQNKADATYVAQVEPQAAVLNQTVVIEKPKVVQPSENKEVAKENGVKTPPRPKSKKQTKEIFSPFDKTPLKKKVEAFEKLEAAAMQQSEVQNAKVKQKSETKTSTGRPKSKLVTPFTSRFMPKTCSTSKISKLYPSGNKLDTSMSGDSTLSAKSVSVLKASQAEFREREKRRQEKEREALKKREALLAAQAEEKKRKREEKQLKAQQQRELLEKDKQKQLEEQQRKDEEKYKQAIAEKQEKIQKHREEAEKKRLIAKEKAQLIKLQEERDAKEAAEKEARAAAKKEAKLGAESNRLKMQKAQQHGLPMYMVSKPPLLPTDDCYDSDCSDYGADVTTPEWAKEKALERKQMVQIIAQEKLKNTFFCRKTHTPDLQDIFEIIDPRKLKRTSSAVWKKPPRYTLFSVTSIVQFSDDEDIDV